MLSTFILASMLATPNSASFISEEIGKDFDFPGGTPQKYVASLFKEFNLPVFVSTQKPTFRPFEVNAVEMVEFISGLETATGLVSHSNHLEDDEEAITDVIFSPKGLAPSAVRGDGRPGRSQLSLSYGDRISMLQFSDGKVNI